MKKNLIWFSCVLGCLAVILASAVYAWLAEPKLQAEVTSLEIDQPPTINILNNEVANLDVLNLDGLQLGEDYSIVFCVTPSSMGTVRYYDFVLAYTTNLGETIDLYPATYIGDDLTAITANYSDFYTTDGEGNRVMNTNCYAARQSRTDSAHWYYYQIEDTMLSYATTNPGDTYTSKGDGYEDGEIAAGKVQDCNETIYKKYNHIISRDSETITYNTKLQFDAFDSETYQPGDWTETMEYKFYVLKITWPEGAGSDLSAQSKETDMIYVVSKGYSAN